MCFGVSVKGQVRVGPGRAAQKNGLHFHANCDAHGDNYTTIDDISMAFVARYTHVWGDLVLGKVDRYLLEYP